MPLAKPFGDISRIGRATALSLKGTI